MSILHKIEVKIGCLNEVGAKLDDFKEKCEKEQHMLEGAIRECTTISNYLTKLHAFVDKDLEKGVIKGITQPLQIASYVKRYISRAVETVSTYSEMLKTQQIQQASEEKAFTKSIEFVKKLFEQEHTKINNIQEAVAKGDAVIDSIGDVKQNLKDEQGNVIHLKGRSKRPVGVHPGKSLKARRLEKQMRKELDEKTSEELEAELLKE